MSSQAHADLDLEAFLADARARAAQVEAERAEDARRQAGEALLREQLAEAEAKRRPFRWSEWAI